MSWFRQEASFFQNPNVVMAGWHGSIVFIVACHMAKLYDWSDGAIDKRYFTPALIRRFSGAPEGCHSDKELEEGIAACVRSDLFTEDETHYYIRSWRKFQPDPTALARKRRQRAREKESRDVTVTDRESRYGTDGTDERNGTDDSLGSASRSGGNGKPKRLSTKQWGCVDGILDALCRGEAGTDAQQRALVWRRLRQAGALGDDIGSDVLDRWLKRFPGAAAKGKKKAGLA